MNSNYELLGIDENADVLTIKNAYRALAKKYHPDRNSDPEAITHFLKITEAYEQLIDKSGNPKTINYSEAEYIKQEEEVRNRAKEYARMRYDRFVQRSTAYDRLSIHKVFWGKEITYLLLLLAFIFNVDFFSPAVTERIPVGKLIIMRSKGNHAVNLKITASGFSFYANDSHTRSDFGNSYILVQYSPLFHFVESYQLPVDDFKINYEPDKKATAYILFPLIVFILSLVTLVYRFKTFESKLMIKMITIIAVFCYLTIYFVMK